MLFRSESALMMVLAHRVEESALERIAESFPKDSDGKEVDVTPFVKPSHRFARKINDYLNDRKKKLISETAQTAKSNEETVGTSTVA